MKDETLFGMVEVDIQVPDEWESTFTQKLSPHEYFSEMSPIMLSHSLIYLAPHNSARSERKSCLTGEL